MEKLLIWIVIYLSRFVAVSITKTNIWMVISKRRPLVGITHLFYVPGQQSYTKWWSRIYKKGPNLDIIVTADVLAL